MRAGDVAPVFVWITWTVPAYDPVADAWRVIRPYPLSPQASSVARTGRETLAWDYLLDAAAYDPDS